MPTITTESFDQADDDGTRPVLANLTGNTVQDLDPAPAHRLLDRLNAAPWQHQLVDDLLAGRRIVWREFDRRQAKRTWLLLVTALELVQRRDVIVTFVDHEGAIRHAQALTDLLGTPVNPVTYERVRGTYTARFTLGGL